jgi:hypothetical protein
MPALVEWRLPADLPADGGLRMLPRTRKQQGRHSLLLIGWKHVTFLARIVEVLTGLHTCVWLRRVSRQADVRGGLRQRHPARVRLQQDDLRKRLLGHPRQNHQLHAGGMPTQYAPRDDHCFCEGPNMIHMHSRHTVVTYCMGSHFPVFGCT